MTARGPADRLSDSWPQPLTWGTPLAPDPRFWDHSPTGSASLVLRPPRSMLQCPVLVEWRLRNKTAPLRSPRSHACLCTIP